MPIVVQKYGGSSVADVARIHAVAQRVMATKEQGFQVVVVVSAMGDTTDELLALAKQVSPEPPRRELDMLLTCGERISMALLSMALQAKGVPAISFTGSQSGIITDAAHAQAKIIEVRPQRIHEALDEGKVVIVAGYQGVSLQREVTTLGRGGSDTTAVALAAALDAVSCDIYSDVDGVFSADPRSIPDAFKLDTLSYEEMQAMARAGARVLNAQAVEFAKKRGIVIHAKQTHGGGTGTRIQAQNPDARPRMAGVATQSAVGLLSANLSEQTLPPLLALLETHGVRSQAFSCVLLKEGQEQTLLRFSLEDVHALESLKRDLHHRFQDTVRLETHWGVVTLVGEGQEGHLTTMKEAFIQAQALGAKVHGLHTGGLELSLVVDADKVQPLSQALHQAFCLRKGERGGPGAGGPVR